MKTYKLIGIPYYTVSFSIKDALFTFLLNKIGVTESNIEETDILPNRDAFGKVFKTLEEYENFEINY